MKIAMESLGCSKNLVDGEIMLGILQSKGYEIINDYEDADVIIVNTCGFINDAKEESINAIVEYSQLKEEGKLKYLLVSGCLAQRYSEDLLKEIPEIDAILGTTGFDEVASVIEGLNKDNEKQITVLRDLRSDYNEDVARYISTPKHKAYIKIGEGCSNRCTYCIIPKLRGNYVSRPMENIIEEAKQLAKKGVKELIVLAQDTTRYGEELYGEPKIAELLAELAKIKEFEWIRPLYMYPEAITEEIVDVIAENDNICNYFDMPIQHASNKILKLMNRRTSKEEIKQKIEMIRNKIPNVVIRTTLITGFPGETDDDFEQLIEFIKELKFERLGAFAYSREEDTPADKLPNQVDEDVKKSRQEAIMMLQQTISEEKSKVCEGKIYKTLIEEQVDDTLYVGRTQRDVEDIDGVVYVESKKELELGTFYNVEITETYEYDLKGRVI